MRLYLVRHGVPVSREIDPERPLSGRGREEVRGLGAILGRAGLRVARVLHSGKRRAAETAELLAAAMDTGPSVERIAGIDPLDPVGEMILEVRDWIEDTMVVGHLPYMGRLSSRLLTGDEEAGVVAFQPATIVCLERLEDGAWILVWVLAPDLARG